jgi:hypothetical protein
MPGGLNTWMQRWYVDKFHGSWDATHSQQLRLYSKLGTLRLQGVIAEIPDYISMLAKDLKLGDSPTGIITLNSVTNEALRKAPRRVQEVNFVKDWWKRPGQPFDFGRLWDPEEIECFKVYCEQVGHITSYCCS